MQGIYREIQKEYDESRRHALDEIEEKKQQLYLKNSELKNLDDQINKIGVDMTKSIIFIEDNKKRQEKIDLLKQKIEELKQKRNKELEKMGIDDSYFTPNFSCKLCEDTGTIGSLEGAKMCSCFRQKVINHTYNKSQIYNIEKENFETFDENIFSDIVNKEKYKSDKSPRENIIYIKNKAKEFVKNFENKETKNLLFVGGTGLGKTFLSNAIAKELIEKGKTVLYQTAGNLMDLAMDYRMNRDNNQIDESQYRELFEVDLLIIDDLGTENVTDARRSELFNLLNTRILNGSKKNIKTLISTNKELKDLVNYYDQRIVSRLIGNFDVYRFFGEDLRLQRK